MIKVSRKRVKPPAKHALLPPAIDWKVLQTTGRLSKAALGRVDHLLLVTPHRIPDSLWRDVPDEKRCKHCRSALARQALGGRFGVRAAGLLSRSAHWPQRPRLQ